MQLIEISHDSIEINLRYATPRNITNGIIYDRPIALLHPNACEALNKAADLAFAQGLRLEILDAYRPVKAQWALWNSLPDPMFVADPKVGSTHNRGIAVDLTLLLVNGQPLDMGTDFDDMTQQSHHARTDVSEIAQRNRLLLAGLMAISGWVHHPHEWWHYNLPESDNFPIIDEEIWSQKLIS